jgi:hypothetical protein
MQTTQTYHPHKHPSHKAIVALRNRTIITFIFVVFGFVFQWSGRFHIIDDNFSSIFTIVFFGIGLLVLSRALFLFAREKIARHGSFFEIGKKISCKSFSLFCVPISFDVFASSVTTVFVVGGNEWLFFTKDKKTKEPKRYLFYPDVFTTKEQKSILAALKKKRIRVVKKRIDPGDLGKLNNPDLEEGTVPGV